MKGKRKIKKGIKSLFFLLFLGILVWVGFYVFKSFDNNQPKDDIIDKKDPIVSNLTDLGFKESEIKILKDKLNETEIKNIETYNSNLVDFVQEKYFIYDNIERYIAYKDKNSYDISTVVMYVNIGIDREFYTEISNVKDSSSLLVLCNKYNALGSDYEPEDLVSVGNSGKLMRKEAAENMQTLLNDAKKDGIYINLISGYRSYDYQEGLYARHVRERGKVEADRVSARPGHSEHQTGLAMDVSDAWDCEKDFDETEHFDWLNKNAYKYGFIIRYPKDKEFITGYDYEPWHYRYVGTEVATIIHNEDITYEEYVVKYLTSY